MTEQQALLGVGVATAVLALWAAIFATRADRAARRARALADGRWEDTVRPLPRISFPVAPGMGQPLDILIENLGGVLAASAIIVQHGDGLFAGELSLPDRAASRRAQLTPVMKAWQLVAQPECLLLAGRDISGQWWDCLEGRKIEKQPARWLAGRLRDLHLEGAVTFPSVSGSAKS